MLAVCGGYQLIGHFYRDRSGAELPGAGVLPLHTVAGDRRMIGDVLLECELEPGDRRTIAGFENHAGRTILEDGAEPLGRVVAGFGNDGESGFEGCRAGRVVGTYLHGPLLPRNPWLADWLLAQAIAHRTGEPAVLEPLTDTLEDEAHRVAAARAKSRGGGAPGSPTSSPPQSYGRSARLWVTRACRTCADVLRNPQRAEVDDRVAWPPARQEALDRRVEHDLLELRDGEEPVPPDGGVARCHGVERPVAEVSREDDVHDMLRREVF